MQPETIFGVDLFCGFGGITEAIGQAMRRHGAPSSMLVVNHNKQAIAWHKRNHPEAEHHRDDLFLLDPATAMRGRRPVFVAGAPSCVQFSWAKGDVPKDEQDRSTAECIINWITAGQPDFAVVENVPEFRLWGPLYPADHPVPKLRLRPIPEKEGETFRAWEAKVDAAGYDMEHRVLVAADYGDATTRTRFFAILVRRGSGLTITWPNPTHSEHATGGLPRWVGMDQFLDRTNTGKSIFKRKKPLVKATLRRIAHGIVKIALPSFEANAEKLTQFMTIMRGQSTCREVEKPLPTLTASGRHHYLDTVFFTKYFGTGGCKAVDLPIDTITTKDRFGVETARLSPTEGVPTPRTVAAVLVCLEAGQMPVFEIGGQLWQVDVLHRLLTVREAADAMSFPRTFDLSGPAYLMKRFIGNSVPVKTASALFDGMISQVIHQRRTA